MMASLLGHCNLRIEVHVLNQVQQLDAIGHGMLEGLSTADESHSASAFVDHGGSHRIGKVIFSRSATGGDQRRTSPVAIGKLVAAELNWVILRREIAVDPRIGFAGLERVE